MSHRLFAVASNPLLGDLYQGMMSIDAWFHLGHMRFGSVDSGC